MCSLEELYEDTLFEPAAYEDTAADAMSDILEETLWDAVDAALDETDAFKAEEACAA